MDWGKGNFSKKREEEERGRRESASKQKRERERERRGLIALPGQVCPQLVFHPAIRP